MKKVKMISIIFILLLTTNIIAQKEDGITFPVNATGSVKLLADNINVTVNLAVEKKNPQEAFNEHKLREEKILNLIKKYGIPDKDISYTLFKISKFKDYRNNKITFKTNQSIHFKFKDFNKYTPLQIDLLKNGFYEFSSDFTTSKRKEGHEKSVEIALKNAKEEAEIYAKNLNMKVGIITSISSENPRIYPRPNLMLKASMAPSKNLLNIPQFITISTNVNVVFRLLRNKK
ncbi:MAG TPA: DUF541 domain-containing protein [Ignavibacteria bacterium]|nr:DUF541 domain-containing protein [Ignavibacteria bacterium]